MSAKVLARELSRAAAAISEADALVITAGAGIGVDSGLPDFRGPQGFWKAYPPLQKRGLELESMSTPRWFHEDPEFAWGFFGHRYNLYSKSTPHEGFQILKGLAEKMELGHFVFTSNVDGHFQKAGFEEERVVECHGSINFLQCLDGDTTIWPVAEGTSFTVNEDTLRAQAPLPVGPPGLNSGLARPNILMFSDYDWIDERTDCQERRLSAFLAGLPSNGRLVVLEIGAGLAVPTVRLKGESLVSSWNGTLIRINPREPETHGDRHISVAMGGLDALKAIQGMLEESIK